MSRQLAIAIIAALTAAPAWTGENNAAPKEEKIGLGTGAAIGAVAGGPVGVILGAAFGGWLGDKFHRERAERNDFEERYTLASAQIESYKTELNGNARELAALKTVLAEEHQSFADALETALAIEVYFRTEQSALDDTTRERLAEVAMLLEPISELSIVIEGHADARGTAEYNDELSAERAAAVRDVLLGAGITPDRIVTHASGETAATAAESDVDSLALDRRVDLKVLRPASAERVAQQ